MIEFTSMSQSSLAKKVLLRGPVLTQSGYGVHARQIARWLMNRPGVDLNIQALPWGDTPWLINRDHEDGFVGKLMEKTINPDGQFYDMTVQLQLPNEWDPRLGRVNVGVTAGVETDRCNPSWIDACNSMSAIVVPSKHTEAVFRNSGDVKREIHVIPESYSKEIVENSKTGIDDLKFSTQFNFLVFGQLTGNNPENDRKNIFYTIKWFCEAFSGDKDVGLVIKTNTGRNTKIDNKLVTQLLTNLLGEVRRGPFPRVHLLHGELTNSEVSSLYRHPQIKALLTLTRGEGYGLPILEAAASGLPVIATGWSGHTDFLSLGKYIDIPYKIEKIHPSRVDGNIFVKDSQWANPSEEEFKKKITKFKNSSSTPKEWALDLKNKIVENYSLEKISSKYEESLGKYL